MQAVGRARRGCETPGDTSHRASCFGPDQKHQEEDANDNYFSYVTLAQTGGRSRRDGTESIGEHLGAVMLMWFEDNSINSFQVLADTAFSFGARD